MTTHLLYATALVKLNWTPEITALVIPQPKQFIPKILLIKQMLCCLFNHSSGVKNNRIGIIR